MRDIQAPPGAPNSLKDAENLIRELRIRVGLLQTELEQVSREHAVLKANIAHDVTMLVRHYVDPAKPLNAPVRNIDGVIFGGWDRDDDARPRNDAPADASSQETRSA